MRTCGIRLKGNLLEFTTTDKNFLIDPWFYNPYYSKERCIFSFYLDKKASWIKATKQLLIKNGKTNIQIYFKNSKEMKVSFEEGGWMFSLDARMKSIR